MRLSCLTPSADSSLTPRLPAGDQQIGRFHSELKALRKGAHVPYAMERLTRLRGALSDAQTTLSQPSPRPDFSRLRRVGSMRAQADLLWSRWVPSPCKGPCVHGSGKTPARVTNKELDKLATQLKALRGSGGAVFFSQRMERLQQELQTAQHAMTCHAPPGDSSTMRRLGALLAECEALRAQRDTLLAQIIVY